MDLTAELANGHGYLGYAVLVLVLVSVARAAQARSKGAPYEEGLPRLAGLVVALQVLYGLVVYGTGRYWNAGAMVAYVHPLLMIGAIATANIATARAKRATEAAAAWAEVVRFQAISLVLIVLGVLAVLGA